MKASRIHINGIVQGVGFRPFVFNLAKDHGIAGWVRNTSAGVDIEAEADDSVLKQFISDLQTKIPPLAKIDEFRSEYIPTQGFTDFTIVHSESDPNAFVPISPDVTICPDCLEELNDPTDRRYRYPFINCTNCGPRFSIIKDIPYDRPYTTMAGFPLCQDCATEYEDPSDRRFHAQPVACPVCGPQVWLELENFEVAAREEHAIQLTRTMLKNGKIVAVKGLGGFHLACDATNPQAVETLRDRKLRVGKPFAVMFPDLTSIENHCLLNDADRELIQSRERPIVVVPRKPDSTISDVIAPGQDTLGVMLPYTPLHFLLLERSPDFPVALVMTSGNLSDEPICTSNKDARDRLRVLADAFLLHDRDIHIRCDDSVVRSVLLENQPAIYQLRRSRGYAPNPIRTGWSMTQILATGAVLKNTFCLTKEQYAFLSHHIGDLDNYETLVSFEEGIQHFQNLFRVMPELIAYDLHPDYMSTRYAIQRAEDENLPALGIQHHHAHIASCMAEHDIPPDSPVIGLSYDGTGYGSDGTIWGGEVLLATYRSFRRARHLKPIPLPGGDAAVKQPWKVAVSWLMSAGIDLEDSLPPTAQIDPEALDTLKKQILGLINSPYTSSMGRLFDAAASVAGIRQQVSYEAQAAIEFEAVVDPHIDDFYTFSMTDSLIDPSEMFRQMVGDVLSNVKMSVVAAKFHNTIAEFSLQVCLDMREKENVNDVALSGGVWQNMVLLEKTINHLEKSGFNILVHRQVPANDAGLALGQAAIAYFTYDQ